MVLTGSYIIPASKFVKINPLIILRPRATEKQKKEAVSYIKTLHREGARATMIGVAKAAASRIKGKLLGKRYAEKERPKTRFSKLCSNVIAIAYKDINFTRKAKKIYVSPKDLMKSNMTKSIMVYIPQSLIGEIQ